MEDHQVCSMGGCDHMTMTLVCDSLTATNKALNAEIEHLRAEVERLKRQIFEDFLDKE